MGMEIKRLLKMREFWLTVLLGIVAIVMGTPFYSQTLPLEAGTWMELVKQGLLTKLMTFLFPVIAVLPVGGVFLSELQSGFLRFYITRETKEEYIRGKVRMTTLGGGLGILLAGVGVWVLYFLMVYPLEVKEILNWTKVSEMLQLMIRAALRGAILANLSGICGALFLNYYMSYGLPFVVYYMLVILKERYLPDMYVLYPPEWLKAEQVWGEGSWGLWLLLVLLVALTAMVHGLLLHHRLQEVG